MSLSIGSVAPPETPRQEWIARLRYVPLTRDVARMILDSLAGYTPQPDDDDLDNLMAALEALRELGISPNNGWDGPSWPSSL